MSSLTIGKYTLESLTSGMYLGPQVLYREYIQNCIDSIEDSVELGLLKRENARILIDLDSEKKKIVIEDNGIGIPTAIAYQVLTDIGNSRKTPKKHRGFRGIGRLVGLSFSSKLIFETSYINESQATTIIFNASRLAELLIPGKFIDMDLIAVLKEVTSISIKEEIPSSHYFRVILEGVNEQDNVLDKATVIDYISQNAPVPYNDDAFSFGPEIKKVFSDYSLELQEYNIFIKEAGELKKIYKQYQNQFLVDKQRKLCDRIIKIGTRVIWKDDRKGISAIIWFSKSNFMGTVLNNSIKGIRYRKGNILVGDKYTLNSIFKEERFNGWFLGEVFIIDEEIFPNARRDNFERNKAYNYLLNELYNVGNGLSKIIRDASSLRNKNKVIETGKEINFIDDFSTNDAKKSEQSDTQRTNLIRDLNSLRGNNDRPKTKYSILNATSKLTLGEAKILEKVFNIILSECGEAGGQKLILSLLDKLNLLA